MLIYGNLNLSELELIKSYSIELYNFMSLSQANIPFNNNINIPINIQEYNISEYKENYFHSFIQNNELVFSSVFKPILDIYMGKKVFILIPSYLFYEDLIESLIKYYQNQYGTISYRVNTIEDFIYLMNSINTTEIINFDINGIYNFDIDRMRYMYNGHFV